MLNKSYFVYLRGLSTGSIFFEFTIMNSEIRSEITEVLQWRNTAAEQEEYVKQRTQKLEAMLNNYEASIYVVYPLTE